MQPWGTLSVDSLHKNKGEVREKDTRRSVFRRRCCDDVPS